VPAPERRAHTGRRRYPSGAAEPSRADEAITRRLTEALALVDVRVLDHLIVGETITSFAERGLL
jgi:DNA repair protein RadC